MTCKQLTNKLQQLNEGLKIEVKKVTTSGRITGKSTTYRLSVEHGKFYVADFTLKGLVKFIENEAVDGVLTMNARFGKQCQVSIKVA